MPSRISVVLALSLTACGGTGAWARPASSASPAKSYVIHAGRLIDGRRATARTKMSLVIEGDRIVAVKSGYLSAKAGQVVVDLKQHTVLPGLMDMHTHLFHENHPKIYSEKFFMNPADFALRSTVYAKRTLMAGFTTVRDLGDAHNVTISLRNAIRNGWVVGPRIFTAAKSLATTGGHADPTNGLNQALAGDPGPKDGVVNSPEEGRKAVRQRYKDGADLIKLTATGGVLSLASSGQNPQFTEAELSAIVQTANDYGMTVAVHAHGAEGMKRALLAGVHSIEHGTYMDDEVIALFKQQDVYYVPTISAGEFVAEKAKDPNYFPEVVRPKAARIGKQIKSTFTKAYKAGVKIAFGTDCGVSPHGSNAKEFGLMVQAGMPEMKAIQAATPSNRRPTRHARTGQARGRSGGAGRPGKEHRSDARRDICDEERGDLPAAVKVIGGGSGGTPGEALLIEHSPFASMFELCPRGRPPSAFSERTRSLGIEVLADRCRRMADGLRRPPGEVYV